jgi:sigma-54 dependent transcriptional regulator, acetoin dehydrogenase operon transcriptional activator AcoR
MVSLHLDRIFASVAGRTQTPCHPIGSEVAASWKRCLEEYCLEPTRVNRPQVLTSTELKEFSCQAGDLIDIAQPELNRLLHRLISDDYIVLLTNAEGITVDYRAGARIEDDARRYGLYLGSIWAERQQGTNGVGTCLRIQRPVSIVQEDHFAPHNTGLTCTVAPVYGPGGQITAVLDVSTPRVTDHGQQHFLLDVVVNSARRIENRIFRQHHRDAVVVQLSPDRDFIDAAEECLIAVNPTGRVAAADRHAIQLLQPRVREPLLGQPIEKALHVRERVLSATAEDMPIDLSELTGARGQLYARILPQRRSSVASTNRSVTVRRERHGGDHCNLDTLAGSDPRMLCAVDTARRLVGVGLPILITGETGTGKGAFAEALHRESRRAGYPFVSINCAAIPETLIESELFGYQPGAFTGAAKSGARGKVLEANNGTLFLDEIGDMPLLLQTRLLRMLSEGEVIPLGGGQSQKLDVAVITATHQPLEQLIAQGRFREDLYYRLMGATLRLPTLRERSDRSPLIARIFVEEGLAQGNKARLAPTTSTFLENYFWPGNIRELRHVARYAVALCDDEEIMPKHLPEHLRGPDGENGDESHGLRMALDRCRWNVTATAQMLGISRATLHRKIHSCGLQRP